MNTLFQLTILGSSSAMPTSVKYPTAQVLQVPGRLFLIDCGEGTQHQLRVNRIPISQINHILISHLHGDHFFGLIGLLSTQLLMGRQQDLHLYADSRLKEYVDSQFQFLGMNHPGFKMIFHPLNFNRADQIYEDKLITITSFPLNHRIPCCGFRFDEKPRQPNIRKDQLKRYQIPIREIKQIKAGKNFLSASGELILNDRLVTPAAAPRSYAFCSDTAYSPNIIPHLKDIDLLYHEATFEKCDEALARATFHSTGEQAARMANEAGAKKLLIGHFSARYRTSNSIINEAKAVFKTTEAAEENTKWSF